METPNNNLILILDFLKKKISHISYNIFLLKISNTHYFFLEDKNTKLINKNKIKKKLINKSLKL